MAGMLQSEMVREVLEGRVRSIARMMSRAETGKAEARGQMAELYRHTGRAHVVGLTGVPGSGKSTMVQVLAKTYRGSGRKVGIVAIDPSSPFSGGAILGDRVRMSDLTSDPGVFIRSMATRGALGGLARASLDAVDILDAAGFDVVVVETVGVGQDEVDVVQVAQTVVVVSAPGLGDDIQAIKAGILEIADIHVVSKCDRSDANKTLTDLRGMMALGVRAGDPAAWKVPVMGTSAESGEGIEELVATIDSHRAHLDETGAIEARRRRLLEMRILKIAEDIVRSRFVGRRDGEMSGLVDRVMTRDLDPYSAAVDLLSAINRD